MKLILGLMMFVIILASWSARAESNPQFTEAELKQAREQLSRIPITAAKTTRELREQVRSQGRPVPLVQGKVGYIYWDYLVINEMQRLSTVLRETRDLHGCVVISFEIGPDGKADQFEIVKSEPTGLFDKLALRALHVTEYEPPGPAATPAPKQRHQKATWFLIARPPRTEVSRVNESVEDSRNKRREALRAACEGPAP